MLTKLSKNSLIRNGEENEKVIRNAYADPDRRQKLITSRGSSLARVCQVWSTSVFTFASYPVYRMTELVGGGCHCAVSLTLQFKSGEIQVSVTTTYEQFRYG